MIQKLKKNKKGFTLVELIVVIAILGVLMAVLVPQYIQYLEKSKEGTDASVLGELLHAAELEAAMAERTADITIAGTVSAAGAIAITLVDTTNIDDALAAVVKSDKGLQSKDGKALASFNIVIGADGTAKWDTATAARIKLIGDGIANNMTAAS